MTLEERFWKYVDKNGPLPKDTSLGNCWFWIGGRTPAGYGRFWDGNRLVGAHQIGFLLQNDYELRLSSTEPQVLHKCDNPSCVRGSHLFAGTQQDNVNDMIEKERSRSAEVGRRHIENKTGIFGRTPEKHREDSRKAGRKNVESGHILNIATPESCSKGGHTQGRKAVENGQIQTIATPKSRSKGGRISNHLRWHVRRNKPNPDCNLCAKREAI